MKRKIDLAIGYLCGAWFKYAIMYGLIKSPSLVWHCSSAKEIRQKFKGTVGYYFVSWELKEK